MPTFWLGILLILLFAVQLHWLPAASTYVSVFESPWQAVVNLFLPALTLGIYVSGIFARFLRASLLGEAARRLRAHRALQGPAERDVVGRHVMRNALLPFVTIVGLMMANFIGGTVVTESVFTYPGLGRLLIQAISTRDYPLIQGCILFILVVFVLINLLVDVLYAYIDPRIDYRPDPSAGRGRLPRPVAKGRPATRYSQSTFADAAQAASTARFPLLQAPGAGRRAPILVGLRPKTSVPSASASGGRPGRPTGLLDLGVDARGPQSAGKRAGATMPNHLGRPGTGHSKPAPRLLADRRRVRQGPGSLRFGPAGDADAADRVAGAHQRPRPWTAWAKPNSAEPPITGVMISRVLAAVGHPCTTRPRRRRDSA